jgi:hypothetical protein
MYEFESLGEDKAYFKLNKVFKQLMLERLFIEIDPAGTPEANLEIKLFNDGSLASNTKRSLEPTANEIAQPTNLVVDITSVKYAVSKNDKLVPGFTPDINGYYVFDDNSLGHANALYITFDLEVVVGQGDITYNYVAIVLNGVLVAQGATTSDKTLVDTGVAETNKYERYAAIKL